MPRPWPAAFERGRRSSYRSLRGLREEAHAAELHAGSDPKALRCAGLRIGMGALALGLAIACSACSTPQAMDDEALVTGSVTPREVALKTPEGAPPQGVSVTDWRAAKLALDQALASSQADISVPWENAETGAHGTATPIGTPHAGGCRDFMIAVLAEEKADRWIKGAACRSPRGTVLSEVRLLGQA